MFYKTHFNFILFNNLGSKEAMHMYIRRICLRLEKCVVMKQLG